MTAIVLVTWFASAVLIPLGRADLGASDAANFLAVSGVSPLDIGDDSRHHHCNDCRSRQSILPVARITDPVSGRGPARRSCRLGHFSVPVPVQARRGLAYRSLIFAEPTAPTILDRNYASFDQSVRCFRQVLLGCSECHPHGPGPRSRRRETPSTNRRRKRTKEFVRSRPCCRGLFHFGRVPNEVDRRLGAFEHEVIAP